MAKSKGVEAGKAFIRFGTDTTDLKRSLKRINAQIQDTAAAVGKIGAGTAAVGIGIVTPFIAAANAAGDAQETLSRFSAIFGEQTEAAGKFAAALADDVGRSATELKSTLSDFQGLALGLGFNPAEARDLSESLTGLSLDFASFNNLTDADAAGRFISALTGSSEVVDRYGINLKQAALNQRLLNDGINPAAASEQQKTLARMAIIYDSLGAQGAVGDAIRTADSYNNATKRLSAGLLEFKRTVGAAVLPVLGPLVATAGKLAEAFKDLAEENPELIRTIFKVGIGATVAGTALAGLAGAVLILPPLIGALATGLAGIASIALPALVAGFAALSLATLPIGDIFRGLGGAVKGFGGIVGSVLGPVGEVFRGLAADVKAAVGDVAGALADGDIAAAGKLLFANLRVAFETGQLALITTWEKFKAGFLKVGADAFLGISTFAIGATAAIESAFVNLSAALGSVFTKIGGQAEEAFGLVQYAATVAAIKVRTSYDSDFDGDAKRAEAAEKLRGTVQGNAKGERAAIASIERERQDAIADIEQRVADTLASRGEAAELFVGNVEEAKNAALEAANAELAAAMRELAAVRGERADSGGGGTSAIGDALKNLAAGLDVSAGRDVAARASQSVTGTFDTSNLAQLFGGDRTQDRIMAATERTATETLRTRRAIESQRPGDAVFGA